MSVKIVNIRTMRAWGIWKCDTVETVTDGRQGIIWKSEGMNINSVIGSMYDCWCARHEVFYGQLEALQLQACGEPHSSILFRRPQRSVVGQRFLKMEYGRHMFRCPIHIA